MAVVSRVMSMAVRTTRVLPLARGMATVKFTSDHEWVKVRQFAHVIRSSLSVCGLMYQTKS